MDIWITWCKRESKCRYCKQSIEEAAPMVKGKFWLKNNEAIRFPQIYRWHTNCWLEEGMNYLSNHPYEKVKRGRRNMPLDKETKVERTKLLVKRAGMVRSLREAIEDGNVDRVISTYNRIEGLKADIEKLGGVPKSWVKSS